MSLKNDTYEELVIKLGVVIEQVQVIKRGLREHPNEEIFQKVILFMKDESNNIMKELIKRRNL